MISLLLVLWFIYAIVNSLKEGVTTTAAIVRAAPRSKEVRQGAMGKIGKSMADGFAVRWSEGADLRTKKRTARLNRKTKQWEERQRRRSGNGTDLDIPDWLKPSPDQTRPTPPDQTGGPADVRTGPEPAGPPAGPDRDQTEGGPGGPVENAGPPDQTGPTDTNPPADGPAAPPPTPVRPGRPHLAIVPQPADIPVGEPMPVTTTTPTGEVVNPAHLVAFFDGIARSPAALLPAIEAAIANLGKVGFSDTGVTGPIRQIQQALTVIREQATAGRAAASRHVQHAAQTAATPGAAIDNRWYGARSATGSAPAPSTPAPTA